MEQGTVATIAPEVGGGRTPKRWTRQTGPCSRRPAEAHNFVRFGREFKKRPRGERVDYHKGSEGLSGRTKPEALFRDIGSYPGARSGRDAPTPHPQNVGN
jgi:hypothetical protein